MARPRNAPVLCVSACALEGGGKTHFALTMSALTNGDPIDVFTIDPNTKEVVEQYQRDHPDVEIRLHKYKIPGIFYGGRGDVQDAADGVWNDWLDDISPFVTGKESTGGIVIDTGTTFHHLQLTAEHGKLQEIPQFSRAKSNNRWQGILRDLKDSGVHVAVLHRLRDKYVDDKKVTGEYEREGCSKTGYEVNIEVFLHHDPTIEGEVEDQFGMTVVRCTPRPGIIGKEKWGIKRDGSSWASWEALARLAYPDAEW